MNNQSINQMCKCLGTRPKLQAKRQDRPSDDFAMSADGKLMINEPEETEEAHEENENNNDKLDIGQQDMLGGMPTLSSMCDFVIG